MATRVPAIVASHKCFFILQISLLFAPVVRYFWRMLGQSDVGRVVSVA